MRILHLSILVTFTFSLLAGNDPNHREVPPPHGVATGKAAAPGHPLVRMGEAKACLVLPEHEPLGLQGIVDDFVAIIERSSGVRLPVYSDHETKKIASAETRLFVGNTAQAMTADLRQEELPRDSYQIAVRDHDIYFLGSQHEKRSPRFPSSQPIRWALNTILEEAVGVRWLWPGELGTYVPQHQEITFQAREIIYTPKLVRRMLRLRIRQPLAKDGDVSNRLRSEVVTWAENHQYGRRDYGVDFSHSFRSWWEKYGEQHPDYFAVPPKGITPPGTGPTMAKLRLANPAVIEQIAADYQNAKAPKYWNVCPNDGRGFDLSPETRAWDIPTDLDPQAIWNSKANLTPRFVEFWNRLSARLQKINPEVVLCTYAYASYREPPPAERPLTAKTMIALVPGFNDYKMWTAWGDQQGVQGVYLRPNWGHLAAHAPYLPLSDTHAYLQFCWDNKMQGIDIDSILGYWATQGPLYYLWARMLSRPNLSLDTIIDEYCAAFGSATATIREYLDYWQGLSNEVRIIDPYAWESKSYRGGRFAKLVAEGKTRVNFIYGSRDALPYVYTDEVIHRGHALLDKAAKQLTENETEARKRIRFLKFGLAELRASRDLLAFSRKADKNSLEDMQKLKSMSDAVETLREKISPSHAIWGESINSYENHYQIPVRPSNIHNSKLDLSGM